MNMIDVQDKLKNLSEDQLIREMQAPSGSAPQFLVLSEITRRKRMRDSLNAQNAQSQPTVAEEAVAAAGVPQGGIMPMARALAPNSSIAQNTGVSPVQKMSGGGYVQKMAPGGSISTGSAGIATLMANPAARAYAEREAQRLGMTLEQYLTEAMPEQTNQMMTSLVNRQSTRDRMLGLEPAGDGITFPSQSDLDRRFEESQNQPSIFPDSGFSVPSAAPVAMTYGRPIYETLASKTGTLLPDDMIDLDLTMPEIRDALGEFEKNYTTSTEDFIDPVMEFLGRPDETVRSIDPYTGRFVDLPTLGTQIRGAGNAIVDLVSKIPAFDLSRGNPYSELSPEEMKALTDGTMSPETADSLQASRLAMQQYGRGAEGATNAAAPAAPAVAPAADSGAAGGRGTVVGPDAGGAGGAGTVTGGGGAATTTGGGGSGVAAAVGGSPMSSYEQELMDALQRADKRAEQDKWLALAQVGLNLMSSTQPTLGGAIGEAGAAGLEAFRSARNTAEEERLGLNKALYDLQSSRASALAAQRAAGARAAGKPLTLAELEDMYNMLTVESEDPVTGAKTRVARDPQAAGQLLQVQDAIESLIASRIAPPM